MKKVLLIPLLIFTFQFIFFKFSLADYSSSLQTYKSSYEKYRTIYEEFTKAKNTYLKYKTLSTQTESLNKTKQIIETRDQVIIDFFYALKDKVNETNGLTPFEKNLRSISIDNKISLLKKHQEGISAVASLEDAFEKSVNIEKYKTDFESETYQDLGAVLVGKVTLQKDTLGQIINYLAVIINQIKAEGKNVDKLERWLLEVNYKFELGEKKLKDAQNLFDTLSDENFGKNQVYIQGKALTAEGNQYFKEAVKNGEELIKEIQNGPY